MFSTWSKREKFIALGITIAITGIWFVLMALLLGLFSAGYAVIAWGILITILVLVLLMKGQGEKK